jgi:hypothetical protein
MYGGTAMPAGCRQRTPSQLGPLAKVMTEVLADPGPLKP